MGCCLSTTKTPRDHHYKPGSTTHQRLPVKSPLPEPDLTHVRDNRDPPPPVEDEFESVKEVLSETPFVPKPQNPVPVEDEAEIEEETKTQVAVETKGLINVLHKAQNEVSEASQISESFTLSTTTTATTITVTEKKEEDEATSKCSREARVPRKRPYTGDLAGRRERAAKSPARRAEPSPEKRRSQGRGMGDVRSRRLNMGTPAGVRRDSGEGSGRRSRSPATRTAGGWRAKSKEAARGANPKENWTKRNEVEGNVIHGAQVSSNNFLPRASHPSLPAGLLNTAIPYNYQWDPSNFPPTHFGSHGFTSQTEDQPSYSVMSLPSTLSLSTGGPQILVCPPGTTQPFFPSHAMASGETDMRQVNHFQMLSSSSHTHLPNSLTPPVYPTSQTIRSFNFNVTPPKPLHSPTSSGCQPNNDQEFPSK